MRNSMLHTSAVRLAVLLAVTTVIAACATGAIRERNLTLPVIEGATYVGDKECQGCHEGTMSAFAGTAHGKLADFEIMGGTKGCESCHGPGSLHSKEGDPSKILFHGKLAADQASAICLKCHSSGPQMEWAGTAHALSDVSCTDCHKIHQAKTLVKKSLAKTEPAICYGCHQDYQAKMSLPSHHPVKEGKMTCSSCHESHGSSMKNLKTEERLNDLCYTCHARYQGPFVFEHAPVQEDCNICHDPHGAVAYNLLKQNEPFLCLQCHESHFHAIREGATINPGNTAFDANRLTGTPTGAPTSANDVGYTNSHGADGWRMAFGTKCSVCHPRVHGSDLPSQTAPSTNSTDTKGWPSGGMGLTR